MSDFSVKDKDVNQIRRTNLIPIIHICSINTHCTHFSCNTYKLQDIQFGSNYLY